MWCRPSPAFGAPLKGDLLAPSLIRPCPHRQARSHWLVSPLSSSGIVPPWDPILESWRDSLTWVGWQVPVRPQDGLCTPQPLKSRTRRPGLPPASCSRGLSADDFPHAKTLGIVHTVKSDEDRWASLVAENKSLSEVPPEGWDFRQGAGLPICVARWA